MDTFTVRDLRERTGELVRGFEAGELQLLTKRGRPLAVGVPLDETLLEQGVHVALATALFKSGVVSIGKAAELSGLSIEALAQHLSDQGIPVVDYPAEELLDELADLG